MLQYDTSGDYKLLGYKCIAELPYNDPIIVGKYGCIYKFYDQYRIIFFSPQVGKRWGVEFSKGEEGGLVTDETTAKKIRKELKTFRSLQAQADKLVELNTVSLD